MFLTLKFFYRVISVTTASIIFTIIATSQVIATDHLTLTDRQELALRTTKLKKLLLDAEQEATQFSRIFTLTDRQDRALHGEMEAKAKKAKGIYEFHNAAVIEAISQHDVILGIIPSLSQLEQQLAGLEKETDGLQTALTQLTTVHRSAQLQQQVVCGYKNQSLTSPYPSNDKLRDWIQESKKAFDQARDSVGKATEDTRGRDQRVSVLASKIKVGKGKPKDDLLIQFKLASDALSGMQEAKSLATRAEQIEKKLISDAEMLTSLKKKGLFSVFQGGYIRNLAMFRKEEGVALFITKQLLGWKEVARVYHDASILSGPFNLTLEPDFLEKVSKNIKSLSELIPKMRKGLEQVNAIGNRIDVAQARADSVLETALQERIAAERTVLQLKQCLDKLKAASRKTPDLDPDYPSMTCQKYHDNLKYVVEEIGRLTKQYTKLKEAGHSMTELKPSACSVVDRSTEFATIKMAAIKEGCTVTLQDPTAMLSEYDQRCNAQGENVVNQPVNSTHIYQGQLNRSVNYNAPSPDPKKCPVSKIKCSGKGPLITATIDQDQNEYHVTIGATALTTLTIHSYAGMSCGNSIKVKDGALSMTLRKKPNEDVYVYTPDKKNLLQNLMCQGKSCKTEARAWLTGSVLNFEFNGASKNNYTHCGPATRRWIWKAEMQQNQ